MKKPKISIVISTYNGSKKLGETIEALLNQDFSKREYEILVINDGSTDNTLDIVSKYPVKIINHKKNLGRYTARNTGLKNANGEIIAYLDDDCIADRNWLKELLKGYNNKKVMGVGGLVKNYYLDTILDRYQSQQGYGNPQPIEADRNKNVLKRFLVYLKNMINPIQLNSKNNFQVAMIFANASFLKEALIKSGRWDESLKFRGDAEMCSRLNITFPNKKLLLNKNAIIYHKHRAGSLTHLLKDNFIRSKNTFDFHVKQKKFPPIFPFPLATIFLSIVLSFFNILFLPISLILLPQIFYFWWSIKFMKTFKFEYLLYPFIQMLIEVSITLGVLRGFFLHLRDKLNKK